MTTTLPMDPLVERVSWQLGIPAESVSPARLAEAVGVTARTVHRWKAKGRVIPINSCDRLAINLGWHPCVIWPEWAT